MKDFIFCAVCFLIILSIIYKPKNEYEVACQVPDEYQKGWYTIDRDCYEQKEKNLTINSHTIPKQANIPSWLKMVFGDTTVINM